MAIDHNADMKRHVPAPNEKAVAGIVKHLGIALKSNDAAMVSCSSKDELARVRDSWLKKKLALGDDDKALDAAIKEVCEKMKAVMAVACAADPITTVRKPPMRSAI